MKRYFKFLIITVFSFVFFTGCTEEQTTKFVSDNTTTSKTKEYKFVDNTNISNLALHYKSEGEKSSFNLGMSIDVKVDASNTQDNNTQFSYDDRNVILTTSSIASRLQKGNIDPIALELLSDDIFFLGKYSFEDITSTSKTFSQRFTIPNELKRLYDSNANTKYKILLAKDDGGQLSNVVSSSEFTLTNETKGEVVIKEFKTGLAGNNFAVIDAQYSELYKALKPYIETNYPQYSDSFEQLNNDNGNTTYCQSAHVATTFRFNQYSNNYSNIVYDSKIQFQIGTTWTDAKVNTGVVSSGNIKGTDHSEKLTTIPVCVAQEHLTSLFDEYIKKLDEGKVTLKIPVRVSIGVKGDNTNLDTVSEQTVLEVAFTVPTGFKRSAYLAKTPISVVDKSYKSVSKAVTNREGKIDTASYDKKVGLDFAGVGIRTLYDSDYSDTSDTSATHVYANFEHKIYAYAGGSEITLHRRHYTAHSYANDMRKNAFSVDGFSPFGQLSYSRLFSGCKAGSYVSDICAFSDLKLEDKLTFEASSDPKQEPEFGYSSDIAFKFFSDLKYNSDGTFKATPLQFTTSFSPKFDFVENIKDMKKKLGQGTQAVGATPLKFIIGITATVGSDLEATNINKIKLKGNFLYASAAVWAKAGLDIDAILLKIFAGAIGEVELARVNFAHDLSIIYKLDDEKHFDLIVSDVYAGLNLNFVKGKIALFIELALNLGLFEIKTNTEFIIVETPYLLSLKYDFIKQRRGLQFTKGSNNLPTEVSNPVYNKLEVNSSSQILLGSEILSDNKQFKLFFDTESKIFRVTDIENGVPVTNMFNGINATHIKLGTDGTLIAYLNNTLVGAIECAGTTGSEYMLVLRDDGRVQIFNGTSLNPGSVACDSLIFANENLVSSSSGTASASSQWDNSNWAAAKAFDGILYDNADGNAWMSQNSKVINEYLRYSFNESKIVNAYKIYPRAGSNNDHGIVQALNSWELQGSNDGSNWIILDSVSGQTNWLEKQGRAFGFSNNTAYKNYRILIKGNNDNNSGAVSIGELEFYNIESRDTVVIPNSKKINVNSILSENNTTIANATSAHNNDVWGAWRAFDGKLEDWAWHSNATGAYSLPQALQYKFLKPTIVNSYKVYARKYADTINQAPKSWDFQGSYDGVNWTTLQSISNQTNWTRGEGREFSFNSGVSYTYYRINVKESNGAGSYTSISELILQNSGENYRTLSFNDDSIASASSAHNTTDWGAWRAFDGKVEDSAWHSNTAESLPQKLQYEYLEPTIINSYKIYARTYSTIINQAPNTWTFEGSNDGSTWKELHRVSGESNWTRGEGREFTFDSNIPYRFYRINVSKSNGAGSYTSISELKLIKKDSIDISTDTLVTGESISTFNKIVSPNKRFELRVENNRLVIYQKDIDANIWTSSTTVSNNEFVLSGTNLESFKTNSNTYLSGVWFYDSKQYFMTIKDTGIVEVYEGSKLDSKADTLKFSFGYKQAYLSSEIPPLYLAKLRVGTQVFSDDLEYFLQIGKNGEFNVYKYLKGKSYINDVSEIWIENDPDLVQLSSVNPNISGFEAYTISECGIKIDHNSQSLSGLDGLMTVLNQSVACHDNTELHIDINDGNLSIYSLYKSTDTVYKMIYQPNYFDNDHNEIKFGYSLLKGDSIVSTNKKYRLILDEAGSLKLIDQFEDRVIWEPNIKSNKNLNYFRIGTKIKAATIPYTAYIVDLGGTELVDFDLKGHGYSIKLEDDGSINVYNKDKQYVQTLNLLANSINSTNVLNKGDNIISNNGRYSFGTQTDTNKIVIYDHKEDEVEQLFKNIDTYKNNENHYNINTISLNSEGLYFRSGGEDFDNTAKENISIIYEIQNIEDYKYKNFTISNEGVLEVYGLKDVDSQVQKLWSSDGLYMHYTFDETHQNLMPSGNSTAYGSPKYSGGVYRNALDIDGVDDYIELPNISVGKEFTISLWVNNSTNLNWDRIIDLGMGISDTRVALAFNSGCSGLAFYLKDEGKNLTTTVECGKWHHVVGTVDSTGLVKLYVDGELKSEQQGVAQGERTFTSSFIGKSNYSNDPLSKMKIDDLRIYDNALSAKSILEVYNNGQDYKNALTGMSTHLKFNDNTLDSSGTKDATPSEELNYVNGVENKAISLDGVDDYLELPTMTIGKSYSISSWVYNSGADKSWASVYDFSNGPGNNNILLASPFVGCGNIWFSDKNINFDSESIAVGCNQWNHIVVTVSESGIVKIFVNGVEKLSRQSSVRTQTTLSQNYLGKSSWSSNSLAKMKIDDFRIYDYDLSLDQVKAIYTNGEANSIFKFENNTHDSKAVLTGTSIGSIAYADGIDGKSLDLDGIDDYIDVSDITFGREYTISAWAYNDDATKSWARIFDFGNGQGADNILLAFPGTTCSQIDFADHTSGIFNTFETATLEVECGVWNHYTVSMDTTGLAKIYINGELRLEVNGQARTPKTLTSNYIGKSNWSWDSMSNMKIDNLRIYHRSLNDDKIKELYEREALIVRYELDENTADSINSKDATSTGNISFEEDRTRKSVLLDGKDDYITLPNLSIGSEYTISTWVNNSAFELNNDKVYDLGTGVNSSWTNLSFDYGCSELSYFDKAIGNKYLRAEVSCGKWLHVVTTVDSTGLAKLYVNGILKDTIQGSSKGITTFTSNYIGKSNTSNQPLANMKIANMSIYKRAMSQSEILELYNKDK